MTLTIESLRRKNFTPEDCFKSETAKAKGINNVTNDLNILTCLMKTMDKLQEIRDKIGVAIIPTNIFRCLLLNAAVGGAPGSFHCQGLAADINAKGYTPLELVKWIKASGISVDKCFVERGCVHVQFNLDDAKNENFFGYAESINGKWVVKPL